MRDKIILLVEDNPDNEALTLHAFKRSNIANDAIVARDGVEALDYLFGSGIYAGRDISQAPQNERLPEGRLGMP
jgi:two-component system response regulator